MKDGFHSISEDPHQFGTHRTRGKMKTKFEVGDLDLIFKVSLPRYLKSFKIVSAQYLKNYFMNSHQICCTEAPGQGKDQVRTS